MRFSFKVKLLNDAKIRHPIFHTNLLERINLNISLQKTFYHENDNIIKYKVKRIIAHKLKSFLIK